MGYMRTPIMPKDSIKKTVFIEGTQNESIKYLKVYTNNKVFLGSYGFSDMGYVYDEIDNFYVFNTGINKVNKPLSQPKEFSIFLFNDSGFEIESITFQAPVLSKISEGRYMKFILDFKSLSQNPFFEITINRKKHKFNIVHDWLNYNYESNQKGYYILSNENGKILITENK